MSDVSLHSGVSLSLVTCICRTQAGPKKTDSCQNVTERYCCDKGSIVIFMGLVGWVRWVGWRPPHFSIFVVTTYAQKSSLSTLKFSGTLFEMSPPRFRLIFGVEGSMPLTLTIMSDVVLTCVHVFVHFF